MNKKKFLKILSVGVIIAIGVLGMFALSSTDKESNKRDLKPEVRSVQTQTLKFEDVFLQIEGNGVIEPKRTLDIISEARGKVEFAKNNLKDGTVVSKDEIVVQVDPREVENNLYSLRSDFLNAVASILPELKIDNTTIYSKWRDYFNSLEIDKSIPELPEITNSQEKIKISSRNILTKFYSVKNQEILLSKYTIKAPFDGFIKSGGIIENSFVSVGQKLYSLDEVRNLEIAVPLLVDEFNMIDFRNNSAVKIYPEKDKSIFVTGRIVRKDTKLNRNSQSLNVYIEFTNNKLNSYFLPGNYVYVKIEGEKLKDVASVPRYVVDDENYIFVMEEGKLNRKKVDIVAAQGNYLLIKNSIPDETRVVTTILQKPLIGMEIQSINESSTPDEGSQSLGEDSMSVAAQ